MFYSKNKIYKLLLSIYIHMIDYTIIFNKGDMESTEYHSWKNLSGNSVMASFYKL